MIYHFDISFIFIAEYILINETDIYNNETDILNDETYRRFLKTRTRHYKKDSIFKAYLRGEVNEYDLYEKDISLVHIYFDSSSIIEYQRQVTMTW